MPTGRNDVGRVAKTGTVNVSDMMVIERYSHVMHIVSEVNGELAEGLTATDAIRSAFPAGTLSGAPKIRAMEIIEELQKSRPEIVHLFDEVARQMPEGVYLNGMKQTGSRVEVRGVAQSSTRVSALMRQVDASQWMGDPEVDRVETTQSGNSRQAEFVVYLKQESPGGQDEEFLE